MSIRRAAEDASCWWRRGGAQSDGFMHGNRYPSAQLTALAGFQPQKMPMVKGGGHYFGQKNVGPEMVQLPMSRPRLRWSKELHDKFVSAVNQLGGACSKFKSSIFFMIFFVLSIYAWQENTMLNSFN